METVRQHDGRSEAAGERPGVMAGPPAAARDWALFVDLDGTLFDIAPTPQAVAPDPALGELLGLLAGMLGGALAVVSGRTLDDVDRMLAPCRTAVAAVHGAEWRDGAGHVTRLPVDRRALFDVRMRLDTYARSWPGLLVEDKGVAVAMHFRRAPLLADEVRAFVTAAVMPHADTLVVRTGRAVVEVGPRGIDKGGAIAAFLAAPPFAGRRPVAIGDDLTDEDGFALARRHGGFAILVGGLRPGTAASHRLADVAAARTWLASLPAALAASEAAKRQDANRARSPRARGRESEA